ncbi:MAG: S4 domain-containing protein [Planctomycetota bacterium]
MLHPPPEIQFHAREDLPLLEAVRQGLAAGGRLPSRRRVRAWIEAGAVRVDGAPVRDPASVPPSGARVDVGAGGPDGGGGPPAPGPGAPPPPPLRGPMLSSPRLIKPAARPPRRRGGRGMRRGNWLPLRIMKR